MAKLGKLGTPKPERWQRYTLVLILESTTTITIQFSPKLGVLS
jgi:hypothetical protein